MTALGWTAADADRCVASGAADWQGAVATSGARDIVVDETTIYTLACGNAFGTTTEDVTVTATVPEPEQPAGLDHLVVSEVLFDPGPSDAQGTDSNNEWIEVYNGTGADVDLNGWSIGDGVATDTIASASLVLPAGSYLIVTRAASTDTFWTYGAGTVVVHLDATLGSGGLANGGESAMLYDASGALVDGVSWGTADVAFSPSADVSTLVEGQSIARKDVSVDTDTSADWQIATPTPGA
jgi:hypothetical protein